MGKAGRFACIFVPMGLSIASLICLILVWIGNTSPNGTASSLYFFRADTSHFTTDPDLIKGTNYDHDLLEAVGVSLKAGNLKDFYTVGLWNYCSGDKDDNGNMKLDHCSDRKKNYYFDPVDVWDLHSDAADKVGDKLKDAMNAYKKVIGWTFTCYAVAFFATIAEIVVGFTAIFSRWGSFVTTIVSGLSSFFTLAGTICATAIYGALVGGVDAAFGPFHVKSNLGGSMLATTWLASAFSIAAGFFWLISVCCCSGKSASPAHPSNHAEKGLLAEKTPYSYERVASPAGSSMHRASAPVVPAGGNPYTGPYEPYRHS